MIQIPKYSLSKNWRVVSWIARIIVALILVQTLFFKFTGAPESVYIFKTVGQEPWGRYGSGIVELIASILLIRTIADYGRCRVGLGSHERSHFIPPDQARNCGPG